MGVFALTLSTAGQSCLTIPITHSKKPTQSTGGDSAKAGNFSPAVTLRYAQSENLSKHPPEQPVSAFNVLNIDL